MIHANIPTFKAYVEKKFLFDMDEQYAREYVPCSAFGISSYSNEALTFQMLLEDGSLFSYMPLHALRKKPIERQPNLELSDLVYKNNPGAEIVVTAFEHLKGEMNCYFRNKKLWVPGQYICTIDWYKDNEQFHLVELENHQYAALPNHKVKFKNRDPSFANYKKLHQTWKVSEDLLKPRG